MGPVTVVFGVLFVLLGILGFVPTQDLLALTPVGLGVLLIFLGLLARQERLRKHVMHLAAMLGLLGLVGAVVLVVRVLRQEEEVHGTLAFLMAQLLTAIGCGIFEGLCVKSFIDARRARRRREQAEASS